MCFEILAMHVRENNNIKGIIFEGKELKISRYADDTTLILPDLNSVSKSINTVNNFSKVAGPQLNLDKTEGVLLGNMKRLKINNFQNIRFSESPIKCLGIYIRSDKRENLNWNTKMIQFESTLNVWKRKKSVYIWQSYSP